MLRVSFILIGLLCGVLSQNFGLPQSYNVFFGRNNLFESNLPAPSTGFGFGTGFSAPAAPIGPTQFGVTGPSQFGNTGPQTFGFGNTGLPGQIQIAQPPAPPAPNPGDPSGLGCGTPPVACPKSRYRSFDGSCNNLRNPVLGTPNTPYTRLLPPKYGDGISTPTMSVSGKPLPSSRLVSLVFYPDVPLEDPVWTLAAMQYGQIITHDMSMIAGSTQTTPHQTRCCTDNGQLLELANQPDHCFPIVIPPGDPVYTKFNIKCMNFVRTITNRDRNCIGGYEAAEQLTAVNHFLDLSIVYGNNDQTAIQLRTFQGGRLITDYRNGAEWPPANTNKTGTCFVQSQDEPCYMAGDLRVNQNPQLTILQVILLREHNRIADTLAKLNPHWNDETIYQESRRINIAQHQHISYVEWLPIFIGLENSLHNKIIYNTKGFVDDYNENVNPTVLNEHATAAFRFFHSLIAGRLDLITGHRHSYGNIRISDWFNRPAVIEQNNNFDDLTRGMGTQPELKSDQFHDREITEFWLRNNQPVGQDLKAICIQRNRDHGLASYNDYREFCGLPRAHSFQDFLDYIAPENVEKLAGLYESPDDVDLTIGGSLEKIVPGTLAGPTYLCILTEQFYRTRAGDRFWYENGNHDTGFTLEQLNEIRKASISRLFCDNGHNIRSMQPRGFQRISEHNAVVPCEHLPAVDLSLWRDFGGVQTQGHILL